jgi:sulfide:quinone oxidoreductase
MKPAHIVILGGGFGGVAVASDLRRMLSDEHRITLVDRSPHFLVGATKTWVMLGKREPEQVLQSRLFLQERGVELLQAEITRIDAQNGLVSASRQELRPDFLVVALGTNLNMALIPGLEKAAHTFYTLEAAVRLRQALDSFAGGEVALLIPRLPFKCPPAPYEAALLLQEEITRRGLASKTRLAVYTVEGAPMATAGPEMGALVRQLLASREIGFHPQKKTLSVDGSHKRVHFEDGSQAGYDLLIAIPPHEAPPVARQAGLVSQSGWIPVDPLTFQVSGLSSRIPLYAVGDNITLPLPGRFNPEMPLVLPKAGVMAEAHGRVVADQIAAHISGATPNARFDGAGACYIETGGGRAIKAEGQFFAMPHPRMQADPESEAVFAEKVHWVEGWLRER